MAILKVYSVYDSKIQAYAQPFFMRTRGEAIRGWTDVANDSSTNMYKYAEDYSLMELGEYDESTGVFQNHSAPQNLGIASQYRKNDTATQLKA